MLENTKPPDAPLWELFSPQTDPELIGLVAAEAWERSGQRLYHAMLIAEAELAHVQDGGSWASYLPIESAYHTAAIEEATAAAYLGFCLACAAICASAGASTETLCQRAMTVACIRPMSTTGRAICTARLHAAIDACHRHSSRNTEEATDA